MFEPIQQHVEVRFDYPVHFTNGLFNPENLILRDVVSPDQPETPKKVLCVIDGGVSEHHPNLTKQIEAYFAVHNTTMQLVCTLIVPGGESAKHTMEYVNAIRDMVDKYGVDRHAYIVVIGGGAVIDMAGYAAATAHRGVRLIRVPTTVLSQNDAAVGVKNSVNAYGKKNFIGTFAPPYAVLNDFDFLTTLDLRDWLGGVSEAVKVALLKDPAFFHYIEEHAAAINRREMTPMQYVIYRCAQLHLQHIATSGDPFELGSSRPLDFGHWSAHKLEQTSKFALRHGEAVAIGIALDSTYSYKMGWLAEAEWKRILEVFTKLGLKVYAAELDQYLENRSDPRCVLEGLREFREHLGGKLTIMLLKGIGKGVEVHEIDDELMIESILFLKSYQQVEEPEMIHA
ncbi:MAG: 3-dehydroquinate synthase [Anaerolineae bacterium]